tara:strand:+ start:157 stop:270 length:114 start_codon:yes stop_codon:yes gene_type:complete
MAHNKSFSRAVKSAGESKKLSKKQVAENKTKRKTDLA